MQLGPGLIEFGHIIGIAADSNDLAERIPDGKDRIQHDRFLAGGARVPVFHGNRHTRAKKLGLGRL